MDINLINELVRGISYTNLLQITKDHILIHQTAVLKNIELADRDDSKKINMIIKFIMQEEEHFSTDLLHSMIEMKKEL